MKIIIVLHERVNNIIMCDLEQSLIHTCIHVQIDIIIISMYKVSTIIFIEVMFNYLQ